jgi:hypothetical protein
LGQNRSPFWAAILTQNCEDNGLKVGQTFDSLQVAFLGFNNLHASLRTQAFDRTTNE